MTGRIFKLGADPENYICFTLSDETHAEILESVHNAKSLEDNWKPISIQPIVEEPTDLIKTQSDFPVFWTVPLISRRSADFLCRFLSSGVELLPVVGGDYFVLNVTCLVQALDEQRSTLERFSSGRIMHIEEYWLIEDMLGNDPIFRLTSYHRVDVFVNEDFYKAVLGSELTGFEFEQIWPHQRKNA